MLPYVVKGILNDKSGAGAKNSNETLEGFPFFLENGIFDSS